MKTPNDEGSSRIESDMEEMADLAAGLKDLDPEELERIMSVVNDDMQAKVHDVDSHYDTRFTWEYDKGSRPALDKLYEKAKKAQWNAQTDVEWSIDVDQEKGIMDNMAAGGGFAGVNTASMDLSGTPFQSWGEKEWMQFGVEAQNWTLSQFMHGEQGALICTAKIVQTVPWIDAKYYASTQVMDEARHVEVFSRYLDDKLSGHYPVNIHLQSLLDAIIEDGRWDITYLGMQIMVEGLALAAFGFIYQLTNEPLLKQILKYVMSDEARHVAFGVISLKEYYQQLTSAEIRERQEFAYMAATSMRDRFLQQEVWERMGIDPKSVVSLLNQVPERKQFQAMLFAKIVPNCRKLGLLDASNSWLRDRFTEMGIIGFEHLDDTGSEYEELQVVSG